MSQDLSLNVSANTSNAQASMGQLATITEAQMKRIAAFVKAATDEQNKMAKAVKDAANSSSYQALTDGANRVASAHAGVSRELLVLTHEMSQGNFSLFGGSMLVLAERTNALEFAMTATGAASLGLGAALVGSLALIAMGAVDAEKFAKSLQLTGNYAAVTSSQLKLMADAQAKQTGQTPGAARGSLETVAGSGLFGPAEVAVAARAMGDYQRLTGETAADALKKFQSIQDGVAKWAEEENKSVHFLTLAEYDHIKAMEDAGDTQGAAIAALTSYSQTIESRGEPSLGVLARAWRFVADSASDAAQAMMQAGRPTTLDDRVNDVQRRIGDAKSGNSGGSWDDRQREIAQSQAELTGLLQQQFQASERMAASSTTAMVQQAAIQGKAYEDSILRQAHAISARTEELKKWDAQRDHDAAAGKPMSDTDYKAGVSEINKRYSSQPGDAQAKEYSSLMATIKAYNSTTDEETSRLGALTAGQKFLIQVQEDLQKSGEKLTATQKAGILGNAQQAASLRDIADLEVKAQAAALARIQADTANQQSQQALVESVVQTGNSQADAFIRQMNTIGKSADALVKQNALQSFDDMVGKALLGADGETVKRINEVATVLRTNLGAAIDANKAKQDAFNASFANGFQKASEDYVKQSGDNAAHVQKLFTDATTGMTNALATFAETGKLSWKGLIDSMVDDLIRLGIQKEFAALLGGGSGGSSASGGLFAALAGGIFGGTASGSGSASFANLFSSDFGGAAFAGGIDNVPYNGMPAVLHEGERVMTKIDNQRSQSNNGHTVNIDQRGMSFGAGVDASTVSAMVKANGEQVKAEVRRALSTNGRIQ